MGSALRSLVVLVSVVASALAVPARADLAPRIASYTIDAVLDPSARVVSGSAVVHWRNPSRVPATELFVHLYLNAFANNRTSLMIGMRDDAERFLSRHSDPWGSIELAAIYIGDRN